MRMSVTVLTVLWPNGRRNKVKVSPNSSILQVLDEASKKQGFSSCDYELKFHNRILDGSSLLRFSGVPNNATLEAVAATKSKTDSLVTIALQTQDSNERLVAQFTNSSCLWDILKHWEKTRNDVVKLGLGGIPVCVYMRQEIIGEGKLENTTLRSLGLASGNAIIRIIHRTEEIVEQAHVSSNLPKALKPVEPDEVEKKYENPFKVRVVEPASLFEDRIEELTPGKIDSPMDTEDNIETQFSVELNHQVPESRDTMQHAGARKIIHVDEHGSFVYHLDDVRIPLHGDLPDEFYNVTVKDVQFLQADLKRKRRALEERPLLTQEYVLSQLQEKLSKYPKCAIRIQFPDRYVLQSTFPSESNVSSICDFVGRFLAQPDANFYLYTIPPKLILSEDQSLYEAGLVPAATVHFGTDATREPYLSSDILSKEHVEQEFDQGPSLIPTNDISSASISQVNHQTTIEAPGSSKSDSTAKVGKWFTLGK